MSKINCGQNCAFLLSLSMAWYLNSCTHTFCRDRARKITIISNYKTTMTQQFVSVFPVWREYVRYRQWNAFFLSDNNDNVNNVASDSLLRCLHCAHCYFLTCWCFVQEQQTVADDWQRHRPIQFQWHVEFPNRSLMIACNECNYDNYSHNYPNHCVTSCCLFDRRKDSARENVEIFCTIFVDRRTT